MAVPTDGGTGLTRRAVLIAAIAVTALAAGCSNESSYVPPKDPDDAVRASLAAEATRIRQLLAAAIGTGATSGPAQRLATADAVQLEHLAAVGQPAPRSPSPDPQTTPTPTQASPSASALPAAAPSETEISVALSAAADAAIASCLRSVASDVAVLAASIGASNAALSQWFRQDGEQS